MSLRLLERLMPRAKPAAGAKRILFFVPFGLWGIHNQVDVALALALMERGAEVLVIRCHGSLFPCDQLAWTEDKEAECGKCQQAGKKSISKRCPTISLSDVLTAEDRAAAQSWADRLNPADYKSARWQDLKIGEWSFSSLFTYFRISPDRLGEPHIVRTHKLFLQNTLLNYWAVERICKKFRPDHGVVFNGRMAPFRAALEAFNGRKIPALLHERGFIDDTFVFGQDSSIVEARHLRERHAEWKDVPLSAAEAKTVAANLRDREAGRQMNYPAFYSYRSEVGDVRELLNIPAQARILGVFTSSEFEMVGVEGFEELSQQLEWIDALIELFRERDDYLVIRHHPFIYGMAGFPADLNFLRRAREQSRRAPSNVRILMPTEKVNSYALLYHLQGCIAFGSTIGLESAARGIGTACLEVALHSPAGFPILRDRSPAALSKTIESLYAMTDEKTVERARGPYRFYYTMVGRFSAGFKSFGIKNHFEQDERYRSAKDLRPGHDPNLDRLCDHILDGTRLYPSPAAAGPTGSMEEETEFLAAELAAFQKERNPHVPSALLKRAKAFRVCRIQLGAPDEESQASCDRMHLRIPLSNTAEADLYYFAAGRVCFDESFAIAAALELAASREQRPLGFLNGCWLGSREFGTARAPFPSSLEQWREALRGFPGERIACLFVLTSEGFKGLGGDAPDIDALFKLANDPRMIRIERPQLAISHGD